VVAVRLSPKRGDASSKAIEYLSTCSSIDGFIASEVLLALGKVYSDTEPNVMNLHA
jgi:hypothetical protein